MPSSKPSSNDSVSTLSRSRFLAAATLVLLALLAAGCGGDDGAKFKRVEFRAADGVRLDGRLFGDGDAGVVLVHMGREGDSQVDWLGLAQTLSRKDYLVLTYNRRGICPGGRAGCSRGFDDYGSSWKDVVGAIDFVRDHGAEETVVVGASIGAMAVLHAAAEGRIAPEGPVEFGGINHASGYDFDRAQIRRIGGSKLFLSSREDIYGGATAAREWYRWATEPKRLELVPGSDHGTDLLRAGNPLHERVTKLIVDFVERAAPAG
jgi:predicted alpha/beta hydrolase